MAYIRTRNAVLLAKIETTEGTENAPSASTDAILVENPRIKPTANLINTNEVTGSLDGRGPIVGGTRVDLSFDVYLKGSGAAGTAPEFGDLLKASGFAEVITSTAVPSSAEACASGASQTAATLGTSASATAQAYRGMPIIFTSTGAGNSFITNYTTGKVATLTDDMGAALSTGTNYQIPVNVLYKPASDSIPSLTMYLYRDGLLWKVVGARGSMQLSVGAGGVGKMSFTFQGMYLSKSDTSIVTPTYDSTRPQAFKGGVFKINRSVAQINSFSFNCGNQLVNPPNPNATEGFDPAIITARAMTGSMDPAETLVATRDIMTDFKSGTERIISLSWGSTTGNKCGVVLPANIYSDYTPDDREGIATNSVNFATTGQDSGCFLSFY